MQEQDLTLFCDCKSLAHVIRFSCWDDMLSIQMHLRPRRSVFGRLWVALRYVLLCEGDNWSFEDLILTEQDVRKIHEFVGEFLKEVK